MEMDMTTTNDLRIRIDEGAKVISVSGPVFRLEEVLDGIAREERCDPSRHQAEVASMYAYENGDYADRAQVQAFSTELNYGGSRINVSTNRYGTVPLDAFVTDKSVILHYRANLGTFESKKELFDRVVGQMGAY